VDEEHRLNVQAYTDSGYTIEAPGGRTEVELNNSRYDYIYFGGGTPPCT